ncbi:MAG: hypothetical protein GXO30_01945 [Epsilonproteobacteria bacterium]|nr:hypothetical protein [Campylobacterota bacterium]
MKKSILILSIIFIGLSFNACAKKVDPDQQRYEYDRANTAASQEHKSLDKE